MERTKVQYGHIQDFAMNDWGPIYMMGKRRYFPAFWPVIYTKTPFLSQKPIISKNSGQSGDFWKRRLCVAVSTGRNGVLGSQTSHYVSVLTTMFTSPYTAAHRFGIVMMLLDGVFMRDDVNDNFFENYVVCTMLFLKTEGGKY